MINKNLTSDCTTMETETTNSTEVLQMKNINIAKALYVVNKRAKKIRDARKLVKTYLFRHTEFYLPEYSDEMMVFLEEEGILDILKTEIEDEYTDYNDRNNQEANLREMKKNWNRWVEEYVEFYDEDKDDYICYKDYEKYIAEHPDNDNSWLEEALEEMKRYDINMNNADHFESMIENGHSYLRHSKEQEDQLYDLKATMIKVLNLPVKAYHMFSNDNLNYYAFYEFQGFKFHGKVDKTIIEPDDPKIDGTVIDGEISSTGSLKGNTMTIEDAIAILLEALGFGGDDKARYYDGAFASKIANVSLDNVAKKTKTKGRHVKVRGFLFDEDCDYYDDEYQHDDCDCYDDYYYE